MVVVAELVGDREAAEARDPSRHRVVSHGTTVTVTGIIANFNLKLEVEQDLT
jgi:hypothetical protein